MPRIVAIKVFCSSLGKVVENPNNGRVAGSSLLTPVTFACCVRFSTGAFTGGLASPCRLELPPLDSQWTFTVKKLLSPSAVSHSAANGFRLSSQQGFAGSIRPGLYLSVGPGRTSLASDGPPATLLA